MKFEIFYEIKNNMISRRTRNRDFFGNKFIDVIYELYKIGEVEVFTKQQNNNHVSASIVLVNDKINYKMVWFDLYKIKVNFTHFSNRKVSYL